MQLYPAIDVLQKKVVRLTQGDYAQVDVYSEDPARIAQQFREAGAQNVHVVDLDGAKDNALVNFETIRAIVEQGDLFVQVGGGIRDEKRIDAYLSLGVDRVILGSIAVENRTFVQEMVRQYGKYIAIGVDALHGKVAIHGWKTVTDIEAFAFCVELAEMGVTTVIYTDIAKDGKLEGTNLPIYERLNRINGLNIIASGGITYYDELTALQNSHTYGAILGKALYTGKIDLQRALALVAEKE